MGIPMQSTTPDFIPIPHFEWIAQLDEGEVKRARLFDKQASLLLHISRDTNTSQVYEFPLSNSSGKEDFTPIFLYHITQGSNGRPQRLSSDRIKATVQQHQDEIRGFLQKAQWMFKALQGTSLPTGCQPPPNALLYERALRDYRSIVECHQESTPPHTEALPASLPNETPLLRKLYNNQWERLFRDADALETGPHIELSSLEAILLRGLSGNIPALRHQLNSPLDTQDTCPSNFFTGAFLQKMELHQHAAASYKRGLPTHLATNHSYIVHDLGKSCLQLGDHEQACKWFLRAVQLNKRDHNTTLRTVELLKDIQQFEEAQSVLTRSHQEHPDQAEFALALAELHLWRGEHHKARLIHNQLPPTSANDARARRIQGILEFLSGDLNKAKTIFSQLVKNNPDDNESSLWLAEIYLHEENPTAAGPLLTRARQKQQTGAHMALDYFYRLQSSRSNDHEKPCSDFASILKALGHTSSINLKDKTHPELDELLLAALDRFKGNRSSVLTHVEPQGTNTPTNKPRLKHLRLNTPDSIVGSRAACSEALRKLRTDSPDEVLQNFNELINLYDTSPHPFFYRGELYLWLGEWDKAYSDFDEGTTRLTTRWSFVGKAAVHIMRQEYPQALEQLERLRKCFEPLAAATTYVYLGEMYRLLGDYPKAEKFLTDALNAKPGRVACRINLAILYHHQGKLEKSQDMFHGLITQYPRLFWDALDGRPQQWPPRYEELLPLFESALKMMRGNRSSHLITYFDHNNQLRVLQDAIAWNDFARKNAHHIGAALAQRLNEHTLGPVTP